jgi:hypothetical protein
MELIICTHCLTLIFTCSIFFYFRKNTLTECNGNNCIRCLLVCNIIIYTVILTCSLLICCLECELTASHIMSKKYILSLDNIHQQNGTGRALASKIQGCGVQNGFTTA